MTALFKKLNFKEHKQILVVNAPDSFRDELAAMEESTRVIHSIELAGEIEFTLGFVANQVAIEDFINSIQDKLVADPIVWMAYPKASSKKYKCTFNRDTGFGILGQYGFEGVRQVALDEDWSALRFRKVHYIKNITRKESFALTKEGKERTSQKGN